MSFKRLIDLNTTGMIIKIGFSENLGPMLFGNLGFSVKKRWYPIKKKSCLDFRNSVLKYHKHVWKFGSGMKKKSPLYVL